MPEFQISRRETIGALAASAALPIFAKATPGWAKPASDAQASALLDSVAENLLRLYPANATSLGLDVGRRAELRSQLSDRSAAGQRRLAATIKADLARVEALDESRLSFPVRTSVEVVRSAYCTAMEGFAFPYGDNPVAANGHGLGDPVATVERDHAGVLDDLIGDLRLLSDGRLFEQA